MTIPDKHLLRPLVEEYLATTSALLTPTERGEVTRIAQGLAGKDSAIADGCAPETIRSRRKRVYKKLGISGGRELISALLALSLDILARGERLESSIVGPQNAAEDEAMQSHAAL